MTTHSPHLQAIHGRADAGNFKINHYGAVNAPQEANMSEKYKHSYRGYLIDHHSPDPPVVTLENLDPDEWERFIEEANINHLMLYCKDHWGSSYYNTKIGRKHPGLKDKDWVGTIVPILRKHGIEFNAYYCFEYDTYAPKAHPEWAVRRKDGQPLKCGMPANTSNAKWGMPCYETGYRAVSYTHLCPVILGQYGAYRERPGTAVKKHGIHYRGKGTGGRQ